MLPVLAARVGLRPTLNMAAQQAPTLQHHGDYPSSGCATVRALLAPQSCRYPLARSSECRVRGPGCFFQRGLTDPLSAQARGLASSTVPGCSSRPSGHHAAPSQHSIRRDRNRDNLARRGQKRRVKSVPCESLRVQTGEPCRIEDWRGKSPFPLPALRGFPGTTGRLSWLTSIHLLDLVLPISL